MDVQGRPGWFLAPPFQRLARRNPDEVGFVRGKVARFRAFERKAQRTRIVGRHLDAQDGIERQPEAVEARSQVGRTRGDGDAAAHRSSKVGAPKAHFRTSPRIQCARRRSMPQRRGVVTPCAPRDPNAFHSSLVKHTSC